jgi:hypothetical protein
MATKTFNLSKKQLCKFLARTFQHILQAADEDDLQTGDTTDADKHNENLLDATIDCLTRLRKGVGRPADKPTLDYAGTRTPAEESAMALNDTYHDAVAKADGMRRQLAAGGAAEIALSLETQQATCDTLREKLAALGTAVPLTAEREADAVAAYRFGR